MKRAEVSPETRVGNCCGCMRQSLLFKSQGLERYRCSACFERENGRRHHLDPAPARTLGRCSRSYCNDSTTCIEPNNCGRF